MEKYATSCDIGADKWRRTGVLTFGGEKRSEKRLTIVKLRQHLMEVYGRHFSIGTVVELCTPKHKGRRCSQRFKGAAKIKYQRTWKGFMSTCTHRTRYCSLPLDRYRWVHSSVYLLFHIFGYPALTKKC